ncbi:MAG: AAA family ATPase [Acidobacteria bacterium]|nr:AAA family ATPase [Acidobacteriota bacterium]
MRIDRVHIDGFGDFGNASFPSFDEPVTILYGPNEAGKSTLLAFIRMVLFGFPLRGAAEHFPPRAGGNHGGRLELVSDADERFTIERHRGRKGGLVTVTTADGSLVPDSARPALLGHVTALTFQSVFAFDLHELRALESDDESGINSRIYTAGTGAARLPQALKQLRERAEAIYARKGSKQPVARVLKELQDIEGQLRDALSQAQEYGAAVSRSAELEGEGTALDAARAAARSRVEELRRRRQAWDEWVALLDVEARLSEIPDRTGFPDDPIGRLDDLEERCRDADEVVAAARNELERARELADRPVDGEELLGDKSAVEAIRRGRGSFDASVRDLPKRESELSANESDLTSELRDLGPGWDDERLVAFDTSIPRRDEVEQWKARLSSATADLRDRTRDAEQVSQALDEAHQRLQDRQDHLDRSPPSQTSPDAVRARRSALQAARSRLAEFEQAAQRYRDLDAQAGRESEPTAPWPRLALPAALAGLAALLLVVGVVSDRDLAILLTGAALVVAAVVAYVLMPSPSSVQPGDGRGLGRLIEDARRHADERRTALLAALPPLALDLEADQLPGDDQLNSVETALVRDDELNRDRAQLVAAADDAAKDAERVQERCRAAGRRRDEQQATVDAATVEWAAWLERQGLPETLASDTVPELFSRVDTARVVARTAGEKRERIAAIQKDIDSFSADVHAVTDGHPGLGPASDDSSMAVAQLADRIVARFDQTQEAVRARAEAVRAADERDANLVQATSRRTGIADRVRDLLARAHTDDAEEFRLRARQHLERQDLERQRNEHTSALCTVWGGERDLDALRSAFASTTKDETDDALRDAESALAELGRRTTERDEERGRLQLQMKQLSSDEAASRLRGRRAELVEQLRALAAEWSRVVVARALLVRARNTYEEERQPDVVRRAATFFHALTGGRYSKLHVTVGEQKITVLDETGPWKTPEQLSRGTREQLYLALRFGLIQTMGDEAERLPVIVDEILVNFDLERARRAAAAFVELSRTNQVLVLTCHQWIVDLFTEAAPAAAVVDLCAVRVAS